jgi:hypothetical protein
MRGKPYREIAEGLTSRNIPTPRGGDACSLSQRELASLVGRSQGQLANAIRGHDPISSAVVNRLRDVLLA